MGVIGFMVGVGYCFASYMGLAFYYSNNYVWTWRGPYLLGNVFPLYMIVLMFFVPESPRWLLLQGRKEEAQAVLKRLHIDPSGSDEVAIAQYYQMDQQIELDRNLDSSWQHLFFKRSYRKRVILTCGYAFLGQSTGVLVINNFVSR